MASAPVQVMDEAVLELGHQLVGEDGLRVRRRLPIGVECDVLLALARHASGDVILQWEPAGKAPNLVSKQRVGLSLAWVTEVAATDNPDASSTPEAAGEEEDSEHGGLLSVVWPHFQLDLDCGDRHRRDALVQCLRNIVAETAEREPQGGGGLPSREHSARTSTSDSQTSSQQTLQKQEDDKACEDVGLSFEQDPDDGAPSEGPAAAEHEAGALRCPSSPRAGAVKDGPSLAVSSPKPFERPLLVGGEVPEEDLRPERLLGAIDAVEQRILCAREAAVDDYTATLWESSIMYIGSLRRRRLVDLRRTAFHRWSRLVYCENREKMNQDRAQWRLHAIANSERDLQAWYHATFSPEVYRLRGPFWFREALLSRYHNGRKPVDASLTQREELVINNMLCSSDTTHIEVAAQLFVVRELLDKDLYEYFESLLIQDTPITVAGDTLRGRSQTRGKTVTRKFRISFVQGELFLTWKTKYGTQGVGIKEIRELRCYKEDGRGAWVIFTGLTHQEGKQLMSRDSMKTSSNDLTSCRLSLMSSDRTLDLVFDSSEKRSTFQTLIAVLANKEKGLLTASGAAKSDVKMASGARDKSDVESTAWAHDCGVGGEPVDSIGKGLAPWSAQDEKDGQADDHVLIVLPKHTTVLNDGLDPLVQHVVLGCDFR